MNGRTWSKNTITNYLGLGLSRNERIALEVQSNEECQETNRYLILISGDPTCPDEVVRAKRAQKAIESRMGVMEGSDNEQNEEAAATIEFLPSLPSSSAASSPTTLTATPRTGLSPPELLIEARELLKRKSRLFIFNNR
jgi:hypothetical protein